jgi:hypothetical protein
MLVVFWIVAQTCCASFGCGVGASAGVSALLLVGQGADLARAPPRAELAPLAVPKSRSSR